MVMRDKISGKPRGFGFVVFSYPNILDRVLHDRHVIDGRAQENGASVGISVKVSGGFELNVTCEYETGSGLLMIRMFSIGFLKKDLQLLLLLMLVDMVFRPGRHLKQDHLLLDFDLLSWYLRIYHLSSISCDMKPSRGLQLRAAWLVSFTQWWPEIQG